MSSKSIPQTIPWRGLLIVVITAAIYSAVVSYDFVAWDDDLHVYANPRLHPVTWEHLVSFWAAPYQHLYIPLTYTIWAVIAWLSSLLLPVGSASASFFHSANLLLHLGSSCIVYRIGHLLGFSATAVTVGAAVFALHPLQVEAVAWVSGLKDVLCGWWALVAIWQALVYMQTPPARRRWKPYWLATTAFVFALLAKPAAVVVPAIVGVLARGALRQDGRLVCRTWGWWFLVAIGWGIWTKGQQPDAFLTALPTLGERFLVAADAVWFYLGKVVWPVGLGPDYGRTPQLVLASGAYWVSALGVCGLGGVLWLRRRWVHGMAVGVGVLGISLLPVLGLVPFAFQAISTVADRYSYLALFGVALSISWGVQCLPTAWFRGAVGGLVIGFCAVQSMQQVHVWRDSERLFGHALQVNPNSIVAHNNLGLMLARRGDLSGAIAQYQRALKSHPQAAEVHYNLGNAWLRYGNPVQAVASYHQAVQLKPAWAEAQNNLGSALDDLGHLEEAVLYYQRAIQLKPRLASAYNNLGDAFVKQGRITEAVGHFRMALRLEPTWAEAYYNLGIAQTKLGKVQEAIIAYRAALSARPHWPRAALPLAWLLITQPSPPPQAALEAIQLGRQISQVAGPHQAMALYILALAHRMTGNAAEALAAAQRALVHAEISKDSELAGKISADFPSVRQEG